AQLEPAADRTGYAEIDDGVAGGHDRRVVTRQAVVIDGAHPEAAAPAGPAGKGERGVADEVRSAVDVNAMIAAAVEGVRDLGKSAVDREVARDRERELGLIAVGAAGAFELETAVVGD